eukprot:2935898-Prymnesium_polylepis.1
MKGRRPDEGPQTDEGLHTSHSPHTPKARKGARAPHRPNLEATWTRAVHTIQARRPPSRPLALSGQRARPPRVLRQPPRLAREAARVQGARRHARGRRRHPAPFGSRRRRHRLRFAPAGRARTLPPLEPWLSVSHPVGSLNLAFPSVAIGRGCRRIQSANPSSLSGSHPLEPDVVVGFIFVASKRE